MNDWDKMVRAAARSYRGHAEERLLVGREVLRLMQWIPEVDKDGHMLMDFSPLERRVEWRIQLNNEP